MNTIYQKIGKKIPHWFSAIALCGLGFFAHAQTPTTIAATSGKVVVQTPVSSPRTVNPTLIFAPAAGERNGTYLLYVAAWYANQWYFLSLQNFQMKVVPYSGGEVPAYQTASGTELYADQPNGGFAAQTWYLGFGDLSALSGLQLYAGFGRNAEDMLTKGQVQLVYSVP